MLSVKAACERVGEQVGIVPGSSRNWVQRARIDVGSAPGLRTDERAAGPARRKDLRPRSSSRLERSTGRPAGLR